MNASQIIGRMLGYDDVTAIDRVRLSFGAEWADAGPAWVLFGCCGLGALAVLFYVRYQHRGSRRARIVLGIVRALILGLLLVILADPILEVALTSHPRPALWVVVDGSDSMAIADELPEGERKRWQQAVGLSDYLAESRMQSDADDIAAQSRANGAENSADASATPENGRLLDPLTRAARTDYVRALLQRPTQNLLQRLSDKFRLSLYQFDRPGSVRSIALSPDGDETIDPAFVSSQVSADGQVTALGNAFEDLARQQTTGTLAGLLVVSDFGQNAGIAPISAARKMQIPIFTLGVGSTSNIDLSVDLQTPPKMKKAEMTALHGTLRQQGLDGERVIVRVTARRISRASTGTELTDAIPVGETTVTLTSPSVPVEFPYTPEDAGDFVFVAEADPLEAETVVENNRVERDVTIIDDYLRLLFVEYEPSWEWRFVKEVFHRDKLVGLRGFRTYLRSSDPEVRERNELFVPTLTLPRNEFFAYDVIFLGDMPAATLSTRFCEMTKEFVGKFGGGLVVLAGPRFGPGQLGNTPLGDMLPVIVDPDARLRDDRRFEMQLSPMALQYDFMRLGQTDEANRKGWRNLGRLPWYQPVRRLEPSSSTVLAEHPRDKCVDGKTPQPLIAIRRYGRGEVVYLAFNEMWRLRRRYGELHYRQFWGQLIHRLGLSHALGSQKRFVVRTDRQNYQADDHVLVTVEAYDENFEPLEEQDLPERHLAAELLLPSHEADSGERMQAVQIAQFRPGLFETRLPVFDGGEYLIRVTDPITQDVSEVRFQVTSLSAERRSAVRNAELQQSIAAETNGRAYELDTVANILKDFDPPRLTETTVEIFPLWSTWLCFGLVVLLMLGEWLFRKLVNLV